MESQVLRLTLSNGLLVLLKEIHTAPIISHWIWYRVGSRDESPGLSGISHWVEHMQFKGTPQFPAGVLDKVISRLGGVWNAFTFLDWTAYFETLPAESIDLALRLEADRMQNSLFDLEEVEAERDVIISERHGNENEPTFRLAEAMQKAAFQSHSYQHEVIGSMDDLESIQKQDLYNHYRTYYVPNNVVISLAGSFDAKQMLARLQELFEPLPSGVRPPRINGKEPAQTSERLVQLEGPGETTYVQFAYHAPEASHPDFIPLAVLDSLLNGASSMSVFGGGLSNKTSRLYRALVETEIAVSVSGGLQATIDPYLHSFSVIVHPQNRVEAVKEAIDQQISHIQNNPPAKEEVDRAVKQARAIFAYSSESITSQAAWLGFTEMFADQVWFDQYLERLAQVTPEDIQRAAQTYLRPENRVFGAYYPTGERSPDTSEISFE